MSRYDNWLRQRGRAGQPDLTPEQQALGRKVLGELMDSLERAQLYQGKLRREFADGTVVSAQFDGTTPMVTIEAPGAAPEQINPATVAAWIPHGFVFTPGNNASPAGFGLPVQFTQASNDPFDASNTDPGVAPQRWRAGGPCAQVLLTADDATNYPDPSKRMLPIGFDAREWRTGAYAAPSQSKWHAQRPRLNDFGWDRARVGARRALWTALAAALGKAVSLPFLGFYDDAQLQADLLNAYGPDDTHWPLDYRTTAARANADGEAGAYTEALSANQPNPAAALAGYLTGYVKDGDTLDAGVAGGYSTAAARARNAWIEAGNQFWHPSAPSLPTLSWDGYPAQNLPNWLVSGGWVGDVGSAIFPLEGWHYQWRGQTRAVFSRKLYAMGRCIGILPATVISAAIRVETLQHDDGTKYQVNRVVVITWDAADQYGNASGIAYLWKFGVWCVDFPRDGTIPLHVTAVPTGAYDKDTNPTGWQWCGNFTPWPAGAVGSGISLLPGESIWQMWRFNSDGTQVIAAAGNPAFSDTPGAFYAQTVTLGTVAPDQLDCALHAPFTPAAASPIIAADFDDDGAPVWIWMDNYAVVDLPTPEGPVDGVAQMFKWSKGGVAEVSEWAGSGFAIPDKWVLDARDGAMALVDHWYACPGAKSLYQVRLTRMGARVVTDTVLDTAYTAAEEYTSSSYLDRLHASYARDGAGNWVLGYDLGVTEGSSVVYAQAPVCGQPKPATINAPASVHLGSHWLASFGGPAPMAGFDSTMQAFPIGVC